MTTILKAAARGYNDYKKGITTCPFKNEELQSYWNEGFKKADEENRPQLLKRQAILVTFQSNHSERDFTLCLKKENFTYIWHDSSNTFIIPILGGGDAAVMEDILMDYIEDHDLGLKSFLNREINLTQYL